jgi:phenol/toluene 2-monooxygenase (NADH) P4/A4
MSVKHLGDSYEFCSENRIERYGGDINIYIRWERHLLYACPAAYRVPPEMKLRDFLEQMFRPDHAAHPDTEKLDFARCHWRLDRSVWQADLDKSLGENGIGHMSYIEFSSPGLDGLHVMGN